MSDLPEKIWVDVGVDADPSEDGFLDVYVSVEQAADGGDIEFVRADVAQAEIDRLEQELKKAKNKSEKIVQVSGFMVGPPEQHAYMLCGTTEHGRVVMSIGDGNWADVSPTPPEQADD